MFIDDMSVVTVPEPGSFAFAGPGTLLLAARRRSG
jgi:hypothetical protein